MATSDSITPTQLSRPVSVPDAPVLIDGRIEDDHALDPRMIPGAIRRPLESASAGAKEFAGKRTVIVCQRGQKLSPGAAAWPHKGVAAELLEGVDTARPEPAPEGPGLLAAPLGLSRMSADDLAQLPAGLALDDASYRWARDATGETHNRPAGHGAVRSARETAS